MQDDKKKSALPWQLILVMGIVLVAAVLGIGRLIAGDSVGGGVADPLVQIEEPACTASGGEWNSCGSPCRGSDSPFCIQVCVGQCMCETNEDCPFGYNCSDIIEGKGICEKS